jgi:hypothetical protein
VNRLPIDADEGFPQAFRVTIGDRTYGLALQVTVLTEDLPPGPLVLPGPAAYLVLTVTREGPGPAATLLHRKLVTGHDYAAAELVFRFTEMVVDPRNLGGVGAYGSTVVGGVAARWAS